MVRKLVEAQKKSWNDPKVVAQRAELRDQLNWRTTSTYYCHVCERKVTLRRRFGVGTWLMVLVSWGTWLLVLPLYRKRCVFCRGLNVERKVAVAPR